MVEPCDKKKKVSYITITGTFNAIKIKLRLDCFNIALENANNANLLDYYAIYKNKSYIRLLADDKTVTKHQLYDRYCKLTGCIAAITIPLLFSHLSHLYLLVPRSA